jgi:hypothetical protein
MNGTATVFAGVFFATCIGIHASAQSTGNALEQGFKNPPDSAKPRTWWHWTAGNVTKEGITKDLEWMKRVGIAGMQLADVSSGRGQTVEKKIVFGSPEWFDAVRHAASEAQRLGLEMAIFSSAGWSETGGPWVKPEQAMKKLVWSETIVEGSQHFSGQLPMPPSNNGPIRNLRVGGRTNAPADPIYYADVGVVAYRIPASVADALRLQPKITTSNGDADAAALSDDDLNSTFAVRTPDDGGPAWVQLDFEEPFPARAITIAGRGGIPVGRILAGNDSATLQQIVALPGAQLYRQGQVRTFAFPETRAKCFRVEMTGAPLGPAATMNQSPTTPAQQYNLMELKLHAEAHVHRAEEKAGFSFLFEYESVPTPDIPESAVARSADMVELFSKMRADGSLEWDVPPGRWNIVRFGYSLTGAKNRPAPPSGSGFEADKLSRKHMEAYYHGYMDPIEKSLGPLFGTSLRFVMMDSWEAGYQNWTDDMPAEFRRRRGYDLTRYLPVLSGRVVDSALASDRFLWDFRRTLADMFAENHYGTMSDLLHQHGIGIYGEAAGVSLEIPEDTLLNKSKVTIPMGEFWVRDLHPRLMYYQDIRGAASAAHISGGQLVAAEAFTGGGYESPFTLKQVADYWFAQGVNRIVFHTSAHQPRDTKPGNTMVGTHINRNITWAELASPFMTYLARTSYLLQQGRFVADIAYLLNEGAPSTMPIWGAGLTPTMPDGYDYDYLNADVLLNRTSPGNDGRISLPGGMNYRVLVLPETDQIRPELLRKIRELVAGGATVVGRRPVRSPSLMRQPEADAEVAQLATELWGDLDGTSRTIRRYGKGAVIWGLPLNKVTDWLKVPKDFEAGSGTDIAWLHRKEADTDIYYVVNLTDRARDLDAAFRVSGKEAELWHPDTGKTERIGHSNLDDRTSVRLHLDEREAVFVVFRSGSNSSVQPSLAGKPMTVAELNGPWKVSFPPNLGAPGKIQLPTLQSWTANTNDGVKYFSGTAAYSMKLSAPKSWFRSKSKLQLELGTVRDIAEVSVNGKALGIFWKAPYRIDVTDVLKPGDNILEIKVTNEWTNRLIGDRAASPEQKILDPESTAPGGPGGFGAQNQRPVESGLLGPVSIVSVANVQSTSP